MVSENRQPVVVITGGTAGVGRATARKFAHEGYAVAVIARDQGRLQAAEEELRGISGQALGIQNDVSDAYGMEKAADRVERQLGEIDVWVNCAMTGVFAPVSEITPEEFRRVTEVCYLGYVYGTKAALKHMRPRNRGSIVQVGSALAYRGIPLQSAYCASKHAIQGFCDSLRAELLHEKSNIHLCMVQLPAVNTPQFDWVRSRLPHKAQPVPPIYQPEVPAEGIFYAAHSRRREVLVGGSTVKAIFGNKVVPGIADRILAKQGYSGQQTDQPKKEGRSDNLYGPVEGDYAAHGDFDDRAKGRSLQLEWTKHRDGIAMTGLAAGVLVGAAFGLARVLRHNEA
ncbi:MAG: short-chain dehydrogenase/reductase SDR [Puniceicoccaceae bacterium 5H]|nr:MAG: short-chain dehydrogenase/reductase SDR [Puniceicoccaceae bacterium 5H]